ncbi:uncharacterized protein METZ01_LOCUS507482, partial [marine metagenome]
KNDKINDFLDKESSLNKKDVWNKLNKTTKIKLLYEYSECYGEQHKLNNVQLTYNNNSKLSKMF